MTEAEQAANEKAAKNMINLNTDGELKLSRQRDGWRVSRADGEVIGLAPVLDDAIVAALAGKSRVARAHRWALGQALSLALDADGVVELYAPEDDDEDDNDDEDLDDEDTSDEDSDPGVTVRRE